MSKGPKVLIIPRGAVRRPGAPTVAELEAAYGATVLQASDIRLTIREPRSGVTPGGIRWRG